ncbi:Haloacid Dehalogenase Superfamily Class (subfamily) IIA [Roseovarius lutimaris]|uniref:Haloacid Dehalogenase Superfamily Class (Subfamily) IIA n=1 Tax=Roseovarius lutimaris TaxID=1005928 RepID=A0A1I5AQ27_9RHOB|nr:HAD hydrolase-like protein [Roseovarius lutimaris]SFN64482.1 Haloacid Dehalogenase Superfamily Class (subfamily) IIA [Roseovarius lutimaris]
MNGLHGIFDRYEAIRPRLPAVHARPDTEALANLGEIAERIDAFVFDAFGVLNIGETPIPGAADRVADLRARGCQIRVLTNAASYDRAGAVAKFDKLGIALDPDEIITSRDAALCGLDNRLWGVIAATEDTLTDLDMPVIRLGDDPVDYDRAEGFLFLSSADWNNARQGMLEVSLLKHPRRVIIANADLVAPRDHGFSIEPGFYGHQLADLTAAEVLFFGKPFADVHAMAMASLGGIDKGRIAMVGDTLHTDILGGAAAGWRTVLVTQDGLFAGHDVAPFMAQSGLYPDWQVARI